MTRRSNRRPQNLAAGFYQELQNEGKAPLGHEQAPVLHSSTYKLKQQQKRYFDLYANDTEFQRFIRLILQTRTFDYCVTAVVFANTVVVALDNRTQIYDYLELIFFGIYSVEFAMKYYVERELYWLSNYNRLDASLLVISIFQYVFQSIFPDLNVTFLRVLRSLRALRALRSVSLFRSLQVIVSALTNTIKTSFLDIVLLLLLVMFLFAIIGYHLFGSDPNKPNYFSNLGSGMYVLFVWVTSDGWTDRQIVLDEEGFTYNRIFAVTFVFIGNFIFTNLFIAVICKNIDEATDKERKYQRQMREIAKKYKKDVFAKKQKDELLQLMAHQKQMKNTKIQDVFKNLVGQLHHEEILPMSHLSCDLKWIETYAITLKYHENALKKSQSTHFELANTLAELYDRRMQNRKIRESLH